MKPVKPVNPEPPSRDFQATVWDLARARQLRPIDVSGWGRVESWHHFITEANEEQLRAAVEVLQGQGGPA